MVRYWWIKNDDDDVTGLMIICTENEIMKDPGLNKIAISLDECDFGSGSFRIFGDKKSIDNLIKTTSLKNAHDWGNLKASITPGLRDESTTRSKLTHKTF